MRGAGQISHPKLYIGPVLLTNVRGPQRARAGRPHPPNRSLCPVDMNTLPIWLVRSASSTRGTTSRVSGRSDGFQHGLFCQVSNAHANDYQIFRPKGARVTVSKTQSTPLVSWTQWLGEDVKFSKVMASHFRCVHILPGEHQVHRIPVFQPHH